MIKRKFALWLLIVAILASACIVGITVCASAAGATDAMEDIEANLSEYKRGATTSVSKDGYIGIPLEVSVYYSGTDIVTGKVIDATPIAIYVVNTNVERIGTDSDVNIIRSMLDRGYIVVIFDYLNNAKAKSPDLDWSVQGLRTNVVNGTYFSGTGFPSGSYNNNMVVPAGYNIEFDHVFWEIDKHAADGTLERIVEVWNNDFRAKKGTKLIKWVDENGIRKATQTALDGSEPVWLDENGKTDAGGDYILIKYTKAEKIEDCTRADGTPILLDLRMHVTYPTSPGYDVPVMVLSGSSEHIAAGTQTADRPHLNAFLFGGYAAMTFEHGYVPMARSDHYGYFDGDDTDSVTGDNSTYSIHNFNDGRIDTAAMRYIRYLSLSDHAKYSFDNDAIGVYGNSKGGWASMLGEADPDINHARRIHAGYNGKTRYENGKTEDVTFGDYVIDGGEEQPWLTYGDTGIRNGADVIYMSCGWGPYCITSSHVPTFISCNKGDGSYTGVSNQYVNACRTSDVVTLWFEVDQGHTFASAKDMKYGVDTYGAFVDFVGYHLKGDAVKVVYVSRAADSYSGMPTNAPITVKFNGSVSADEVAKITLVNSKGEAIGGTWTALFGNTEWTLATPTLAGDEEYFLTVPADVTGDNGKALGEAYTYTFTTGREKAIEVSTVRGTGGTYVYFTKPQALSVGDAEQELYTLRLTVSDYAVNKLEVYTVSGFDPSSPDRSAVGTLVKTVPVACVGQYDIDLTYLLLDKDEGTSFAFLVKQVNAAGETVVHSSPLETSLGSCVKGGKVSTTLAAAPDGTKALKIYKFSSSTSYTNDKFYQNPATLITNSAIIKEGNLTESDIGRTFRISLKIYDTTSRIVTVQMLSLSNYSAMFTDYNVSYYNVYTKANEWVEISFDHTVYEPLYAEKVGYKTQKLTVYAPLEGSEMSEIYISDVKSVEIFTDVNIDKAEILVGTTEQRKNPLITDYGTVPEQYASVEDYPFVIFDDKGNFIGAHHTFLDTIDKFNNDGALHLAKAFLSTANYWNGESYGTSPASAVILFRRDYTMNPDEKYDNIAQIQGLLTVDLGGYTLTATKSRTVFPATSKAWSGSGDANYFHDTDVKFINGTIATYDKSIITYACTAAEKKRFDIAFENVTLKALGTAKNYVLDYSTSSSTTASNPNISFKNCTFDISGSAASDGVVIFNLGKSVIGANVTVTGGTVIAGNAAFTVFTESDTPSSLTFLKDESGSYTRLEVASASVPGGAFNGGTLKFVKTDDTNEGTTVYTLAPVGLGSYLPMMSVTFDSSLTVNAYVPKDNLVEFTFGGVRYTDPDSTLECVEIDGTAYYRVSVSRNSYRAAGSIPLSVTAELDGSSVTGSFTFSLARYAASVLGSNAASDTEKALILDTLAYVKAAYAYFCNTNLTDFDGMLEGYTPTLTAEGSATAPTEGLVGVTYALANKPVIRFYLSEGADPTAYTFMQGEKGLAGITGTGCIDGKTYTTVDISLDAYRICEEITYYINGTEAGTYHIASYYAFASDDASLKSIVTAFWIYCQSARAYKLAGEA